MNQAESFGYSSTYAITHKNVRSVLYNNFTISWIELMLKRTDPSLF